MNKKKGGIKRQNRKITFTFSTTAFILAFLIALCLGSPDLAKAQTDYAIECDGVDDFAYIPFNPPIDPGDTFTIQMYIYFPDFNYDTKSFITPLRITDENPPKEGAVARTDNAIMPYLDKNNPRIWGAYVCKKKCAYGIKKW